MIRTTDFGRIVASADPTGAIEKTDAPNIAALEEAARHLQAVLAEFVRARHPGAKSIIRSTQRSLSDAYKWL